jgi:hypothetical protein
MKPEPPVASHERQNDNGRKDSQGFANYLPF